MIATFDNMRVAFVWYNGDRSTGEPAGWEEAFVEWPWEEGTFTVCFDPIDDKPVEDWPVVDIIITGPEASYHKRAETLGGYGEEVCEPVRRVWEQMIADEYLADLQMEWASWENRSDELLYEMDEESEVTWRLVNGDKLSRLIHEQREARDEARAAKQWYNWASAAFRREFADADWDWDK